jgi:isoleucyl-tRNA synthetase
MSLAFFVLLKRKVRDGPMDYKETLLMMKTEILMPGNLPKREPDMQARWEEMNLYAAVQE